MMTTDGPSSAKAFRQLRQRRRLVLFIVWSVLMVIGLAGMITTLSTGGWTWLEVGLLVLFTILLSQIVFGFLLAAVGFCVWWRGGDPLRINHSLPRETSSIVPGPTAIVMPIFNEETESVFRRIRLMVESLRETGQDAPFDFFILSDSNDTNRWIGEEMAWLELCKAVNGFGRIFYRKRRVPLHHKSGNIADFCRRWGANYRYMIVLDADSIMSGRALVRLAQLMEANPRAGIIQTNPRSVLGETLFQRIFQFAGHAYGPIFMAGASYWHLGDGNFWGHNAIIRLRPFMEHCAIPELPPTDALGTRILSHDTVEAALMGRAGYGVWFAYDLEGSYEEGPPDLWASLQRDRRWCFGNLQHLWFLVARRLKPSSRLHIWNGILAYLSSPLWLFSLLLGTIQVLNPSPGTGNGVTGNSRPYGWFVFLYVVLLLLLPKFLGVARLLADPNGARRCGGRARVLGSLFGEIVFSILLAPVLMLFYTRFVAAALTGRRASWGSQKRDANQQPTWGQWTVFHGVHTCLVLVWASLILWLAPGFLPWMLLVLIGPLLAIPFSRFTASKAAGGRARRNRMFLIPEETEPPPELRQMEQRESAPEVEFLPAQPSGPNAGLIHAVLDPWVNAFHVSLLRRRSVTSLRTRGYLARVGERLLREGPDAITPQEKRALLWDADTIAELHREVWRLPASRLHGSWIKAFEANTSTPTAASH